jgi:hypothetical protein
MRKLWITYARADNKQGDVDFIRQELAQMGLEVKLDRWHLQVGLRLWDQISDVISDPTQSDAWLIVATANSLASEPCKEEYFYALDRALNSRGSKYPVIALFLSETDPALIPTGIKTRLFVSIADPDWKQRIKAAAEGGVVEAGKLQISPYHLFVHKRPMGQEGVSIEVRPRAGVWAPFIAGVPLAEKSALRPEIMVGPVDRPTRTGILTMTSTADNQKIGMHLMCAGDQATPTRSYYIWCKKLPSKLMFGAEGRAPQYSVDMRELTKSAVFEPKIGTLLGKGRKFSSGPYTLSGLS